MKSLKSPLLILFLLVNVMSTPALALDTIAPDTTKKQKEFKNIVRFNITNPVIFGSKSLIFGYERVLGKHQSISMNLGRYSLPKLISVDFSGNDSIQVQKGTTEKGFNVSADYRFYLAKENKYNAPHGVFLAPYFSYVYFDRKNTWNLNTSNFQGDVNTEFKLTVFTFGGELGYQFIVWKRLAIDFILIGPGVSTYNISTTLSTTLDADDEAALFQKINDALAEKIPGYSLVIDSKEYERSGSTNTTTFGYRFMIHLGFHF